MIARLSSLLVWGLVALATVAWGLRLGGSSLPVPPHAAVAEARPPVAADWGPLMGVKPAAPVEQAPTPVATETRFRLIGVVAPRGGRADGVALIAVDDNPPRTVRQGRELEPGLVLKTVAHRRVELAGEGRPMVVLELPALAEAQRAAPGDLPGLTGARPPGGPPSPGGVPGPGMAGAPLGGMAPPPVSPVLAAPVAAPRAGPTPGPVAAPAPAEAPVDQNGVPTR